MLAFLSVLVTPPDPGQPLVQWIIEQFKTGHYNLAVAGILTMIVWASTHVSWIADRIPPAYRGWLAIILGVVGSVSTNIFAGMGWGNALLNGLTAGSAAVAFWELIGQYVLPKSQKDQVRAKVFDAAHEELKKDPTGNTAMPVGDETTAP